MTLWHEQTSIYWMPTINMKHWVAKITLLDVLWESKWEESWEIRCQYERSEVVFMENDEERRTEVTVEGGTGAFTDEE